MSAPRVVIGIDRLLLADIPLPPGRAERLRARLAEALSRALEDAALPSAAVALERVRVPPVGADEDDEGIVRAVVGAVLDAAGGDGAHNPGGRTHA